MKKQILITSLLVIFTSVIFLGWGDNGHKLVASYAMKDLSSAMQIPQDWQQYVIDHSVDPDYRKSSDKTEAPKHFIDIDFYQEFLKGKMIQNMDLLAKQYPIETIRKEGILPWTIEVTYVNLIKAFKEKNKSNILLNLSDLAHYVGDAHQPQHTTLNYNGQLTDQKGIHFRYEIDMVDSNLIEIKENFESGKPVRIPDIEQFTFNIIYRSNAFNDIINGADKMALKNNGTEKYDSMYKKLLWLRLKYMTIDQLNLAGKDLAAYIYNAWVDAGQPDLSTIK